MSYFSRLAFDICRLVANGQITEAQSKLAGLGCKNTQNQIEGVKAIIQEDLYSVRFRKHFGGVKGYRRRGSKSETTNPNSTISQI
jgi:hypothetical protein